MEGSEDLGERSRLVPQLPELERLPADSEAGAAAWRLDGSAGACDQLPPPPLVPVQRSAVVAQDTPETGVEPLAQLALETRHRADRLTTFLRSTATLPALHRQHLLALLLPVSLRPSRPISPLPGTSSSRPSPVDASPVGPPHSHRPVLLLLARPPSYRLLPARRLVRCTGVRRVQRVDLQLGLLDSR